ncbi:MAG: hypothetical protein AAGA25_06225 [Planctomycetota bacterium]
MIPIDPLIAQGSGSGSGFSLVQVLVSGIIGVIFVSTLIKNAIKESQKNKGQQGLPPGMAEDGGGPSLEEIKARRRAQLQEMSQQRGGRQAPPSSANAGDANLSMAERIARARAAQRGQPPQPQARAGNPLPSEVSPQRRADPRPAPAARGAQAQQQRAEALRSRELQRQQQRREALAARQRQIEQAKAQRTQTSRQQPARPQPATTQRRPLPPVQTPHPKKIQPHEGVHRMVEDAAVQEVGSARREKELAQQDASSQLINFNKLSKKDLRRAFILKEVLDRPVVERDPLAF